jgi:phosphomannomutase
MPTCGTRYYRYNETASDWEQVYAEDLSETQKKKTIAVLREAARTLGYWEDKPFGDIIEDRGSQITFSALGQLAPPEKKYAWDPDGIKKGALRDYAAPLLPELEVRVGGSTSIDVTTSGIDKAYGMKKLIELLRIGVSEVLFFGDRLTEGGNDYPVKAMGVDSLEVSRWQDTALAIEAMLHVL